MNNRTNIIALGVSLLPFVATISTFNAAIGLAGPASLSYEMQDKSKAFSDYANAASGDAMKAKSALNVISPIEKSVCEMAGLEERNGVLSGSSGKGALSGQLTQVCLQVRGIGESLQTTITSTESQREKLSEISAHMKGIVHDETLKIFERTRAFEADAELIEALATQAKEEKVAERLKTQLTVLEGSVMSINVQDGAFGAKQNTAIDGLRNFVGTIKSAVDDLVSPKPDELPPEPPAALHDMAGAIWAYRDRNWAAIALAIGIDAIVLWFAAALGLSLAAKRTRERAVMGAPQWLELEPLESGATDLPANPDNRKGA